MILADDFTSLPLALEAASRMLSTGDGMEPFGDTVVLGPRDYSLDGCRVDIPLNVTLVGQGAKGTRIICRNGGGINLYNQTSPSGPINAMGLNGLRDLMLVCADSSQAPGVSVVGGGGAHVERCAFVGFGLAVDLYQCDEVDIDKCYFGSYATSGTPAGESTGILLRGEANANSISRCKFNGPQTPIAHNAGACNVIDRCRFNDSGHVVIRSADELTFSSCYFEASQRDEFVRVLGNPGWVVAFGLRFFNCYFAGTKPAVRFEPGATTYGFAWTHCQLTGVTAEGAAIVIGDPYCLANASDLRGSMHIGGGDLLSMTSAGGVLP